MQSLNSRLLPLSPFDAKASSTSMPSVPAAATKDPRVGAAATQPRHRVPPARRCRCCCCKELPLGFIVNGAWGGGHGERRPAVGNLALLLLLLCCRLCLLARAACTRARCSVAGLDVAASGEGRSVPNAAISGARPRTRCLAGGLRSGMALAAYVDACTAACVCASGDAAVWCMCVVPSPCGFGRPGPQAD